MNDKTLVKRNNGTEFYRKKKQVKYNKTISFRYEDDKIDILDEYLKKEGE